MMEQLEIGGVSITVIRLSKEDYHNHTCPDCGTIWRHSGANIVDRVKAHSCPKCGTINYKGEFKHPGRDPDYLDWNGDE